MSEQAAKVTVLCTNEALAARIRGTAPKGPLCVEVPDPDKAIYEYAPALYVHVPEVEDFEARRRHMPSILPVVSQDQRPRVALRRELEAHSPAAPWFKGVPDNLHAAIREGHILAVAFAEKLVIDADARRKQSELNGFVEQLSRLEYWMKRHEDELIQHCNRGGPVFVDPFPKLGDSYVHKAYEEAKRWGKCHNLDSPPPDCPCNQDWDVKRARAEFKKLRDWFEGTTGWIQRACILMWLLMRPSPGVENPGFIFVPQDPPDRRPQAASPAAEWVKGLFPFLVPEITVRVEPHPARPPAGESPPPIAPGPFAVRDTEWARVLAQLSSQGPSAEKETALLYSDSLDKVSGKVSPDEVWIEPLVVNAIGQMLGIAVRIRKGAVLVLPECRDTEAKAALVVNLAAQQWGAVQAWLRRPFGSAAPGAGEGHQLPPSDPHSGEGGEDSPPASEDAETPSRKMPSKEAVAAYRLSFLKGQKQENIAAELTKQFSRPVSQGQVSRWIKQVRAFLKAGNVLPDLEGLTRKPDAVDPGAINMGRRQDRRTKRQRLRRDEGAEDDWQ